VTSPCPFCAIPAGRIVHARESAVVIRDGFPVSPGHSLVIPKRHVSSFFEITDAERNDLLTLPTRDIADTFAELYCRQGADPLPVFDTSHTMSYLIKHAGCSRHVGARGRLA